MPETTPVLILHGTDEFALRARAQTLLAALDPATADMNLSRLDGRGLDFEALNMAVNAIPFLSPCRVVVLSGASALPREKLLPLLDRLPPTTKLAILEEETLRADHWLLKWAEKAGAAACVEKWVMPRLKEMPDWILKETRSQKGAIQPEAAALLAGLIGEDTRLAAQEITKLLTYVNYQRPVTVADVKALTPSTAQASIFTLVDALGSGDGRQAQLTLHRLLADEDPFALWGMIIRQFRLLLQAREILDERGSPMDIQTQLGVADFVARKVGEQARRFSLSSLEAVYHRLLEIDEQAKTGQVPLDLALDTLVVELARK